MEIINDDDEERNRASSTDFQAINDEVFRFLSRNDLGFLVEYFTGDYSKTTLQELISMSDEDLVELFGGPLYVNRIRQELDKF